MNENMSAHTLYEVKGHILWMNEWLLRGIIRHDERKVFAIQSGFLENIT